MLEYLIPVGVLVLTFVGVWIFRNWTLREGLLDVPNERSSHERPTPRGGGLIIVIAVLVSYLVSSFFYPAIFSWGYFVGSVLIAIVSLLDDIYSISFLWRILAHSASAAMVLADKGFLSSIELQGAGSPINLGFFGAVLTFVWIIWLINAYNFMDGIDGIAGLQGMLAGLAWSIAGTITKNPGLALFGLSICTSNLAFLFFNWRPASIFMGDVGSAFLGFTFGVTPLVFNTRGEQNFLPIVALFFVWLFVFDSAITIVRRAARGERVWHAHREHLYQRLVKSGLSHGVVSSLYGILTLLICSLTVFAIKFGGEAYFAAYFGIAASSIFLIGLCVKRRALA